MRQRWAAADTTINSALGSTGRPGVEVPSFDDAAAMIASTKPDGMYVSVPPFAHGPAEHSVDAGATLCVEKPVVLGMRVGRDLGRLPGAVHRFGRPRTELPRGRRVGMALATRVEGIPGAPWWRTERIGGGMLVEMHTHAVAMLRLLVGEVKSVCAMTDTRLIGERPELPGLDIPDVEASTLRFASGALGVVANACALVGGLRLPGAGGTHILAQGLGPSLGGGSPSASFEGGKSEPLPGRGLHDHRLNEAFVHAIRTGDR